MLSKNGLRKSRKKKKTPSLKKLKKTLDSILSLLVRRKASDDLGMAKCVSCGRIEPYMSLQCGHYVSRTHLKTRWDLRNCHPQCVSCNIFKKGNYPNYTQYLLNNYGQEWLQCLIRDGQKIKKWTVYDLQKEIEKYKELLNNLSHPLTRTM